MLKNPINIRALMLVLTLVAICTLPSFSATIHVPGDYLTIEAALHSVGIQDGDVVELNAGVYTGEGNGHDIDWAMMNNITLRGAGPGLTTLDAQTLGRAIKFPYIVRATIEGLSIINGRCGNPAIEGTYGFGGGGIYLNTRCTLELINVRGMNCNSYPDTGTHNNGGFIYAGGCDVRAYSSYFSNNSATAGGGFAYGGNWIIENCTFYINHGTVYGTGGGGVARNGTWNVKDSRFILNSANFGGVAANTTWEATNCIFYGNYASNSGWGAEGDSFWGDYGSWDINNCTFQEHTGLTAKNIFYSNSGTEGTLTAKNSIFWGSAHPFLRINGTLSNCDVQGSDLSLLNANNCISSDPKFVNLGLQDFHLAAGSPAIDKGTSEGMPEKDMDQNARKRGLGVDMGAYEFQGPSVKVLSPNGGQSFICGNKIDITWIATDEIYGMTDFPIVIYASSNNGASWDYVLAEAIQNIGLITFEASSSYPPSSEYLVKVAATNLSAESNYNYDVSDSKFGLDQLPVIYVSPSGDDYTGRGTYSNPIGTVQQGLNGVAPSGEVRLLPGVYKGPGKGYGISWPSDKLNVMLRASPEATMPVTLDAEYLGGSIWIESLGYNNSLTIEGMTIQNGNGDWEPIKGGCYWGGGVTCYNSNGGKVFLNRVVGKNCTSTTVGSEQSLGGGFIYIGNVNLFISNSIFYDNLTTGSGGALYSSSSHDIFGSYIYNSIFISNEADLGGSQIHSYHGSITIENCVVSGGRDERISIADFGTAYIHNSMVEGLGFKSYSGINTISSNCFSLDPKFISSSGRDFRFRGDSPCIDHGLTSPGVPITDMAGITRPKGRTYDVGAYEYQGAKYPPVVTVKRPNGGEVFPAFSVCTVEWVATYDAFSGAKPANNYITIMCSLDRGKTWQKITDSMTNNISSISGKYNWSLPSIGTTEVMIYVGASNETANVGWDMSDSAFEVTKIILDTVYISPSGSDVTGNGLSGNPYRSIQKGLDNVAESGQVILSSGLYTGTGNYNINWPETNNITLKAATGTSACTLDAQGNGYGIFINTIDASITIEGLTIKNTTYGITGEMDGAAIYCPNNLYLSVIRCVLENNHAYWTGGGICMYDGELFAGDCVFRNNRANSAADIYFSGSTADIQNSIFVGGSIEAINEYSGNGSILNDGSSVGIVNCDFYDVFVPDDAYYKVIVYGCYIWNSIIWNNHPGSGGVQLDPAGEDVQYSDIQDGYDSTGNISEEPRFLSTDPVSPNYFRLSMSSPCIDTADPDAPSHDLAGNARPNGIGYDMGAYEFLGTPDRTPPTGSVSINSGDVSTETNLVTLTNSASDTIAGMGSGAQMKFSNDGVNWSVPEPYATTKSWALIVGSGIRTVHALYSDAAGNWMTIPVTDTIEIIITSGTMVQQLDGFEGTTSGVTVEVVGSVTYNQTTEECQSGKESLAVEYPGGTDASLIFKLPAVVDMSSQEGIRMWLKGDGSSNYARIVLKESTVEADGELWQTPKFSLADIGWHLVEYNFSVLTEASDSVPGNNTFDKKVEEYQIRFSTTSSRILSNSYALNSASDGFILADYRVKSGGSAIFIDGISSVSDTTPPTIILNALNGGEVLKSDKNYIITWTATDNAGGSGILGSPSTPITIKFSSDAGSTWSMVAQTQNSGTHSWSVPNTPSSNCMILVEAKDALDHVGSDESISVFSIVSGSGGSPRASNVLAGPSPFSPSEGNMKFTYELNRDISIMITIHSLDGKIVWKRKIGSSAEGGKSGKNSVEWDGKTSFGSGIATGVYIYQVSAGGEIIGKGKFLVIK